ncbi:MAG TPA: hypothetical protein VHM88_25960, partial [Candidatus Acidoferrales bacterium]|nr:hypothetical protein [Candidatus Acidoferrales bacterium]
TMRVFDLDNRLLNKAMLEKPLKFSLNRGEQKTTTWDFGIVPLPPAATDRQITIWRNIAESNLPRLGLAPDLSG